jgi:CheY-like chemotaxis protein
METDAPNVDPSMVPTCHPPLLPPSLQGKATILVMDDDPIVRELLRSMLEHLGYDSVCVNEGATAVTVYDAAQSTDRPFAAVILDLHNRLGMGGTATLAALRAVDPQVKAIVCSAQHDDPAMVHSHHYGFVAVLAKPFGLQTLRALLQQLA